MNRTSVLTAAVAALLAAPAFADISPAEQFGAQKAEPTASPAAYAMALDKLSGDDLDDRITPVAADLATRNITIGDRQLAAAMGVNVNDYTTAELAAMFIGKYD